MISKYEKELWSHVKTDIKDYQMSDIEGIYYNTLSAITEAIQVAAMCKRFQKDLGVKNNKR